MSKLLTLINIEIKRNKRFFILYISIFSILTLALNIIQIDKLIKRKSIINSIKESFEGISYGMGILNSNTGLSMLVAISLVGLLVYTISMWIKEYNGNSKSIYTLIMIPQNKYIIYLSKMITTIIMVYTMIIQINIPQNTYVVNCNLENDNLNIVLGKNIDNLEAISIDYDLQNNKGKNEFNIVLENNDKNINQRTILDTVFIKDKIYLVVTDSEYYNYSPPKLDNNIYVINKSTKKISYSGVIHNIRTFDSDIKINKL